MYSHEEAENTIFEHVNNRTHVTKCWKVMKNFIDVKFYFLTKKESSRMAISTLRCI